MENRIAFTKKAGIVVTCTIMMVIMIIGGIFVVNARSIGMASPTPQTNYETEMSFISNETPISKNVKFDTMQEVIEALQDLGLTDLGLDFPHIGRMSPYEPIIFYSEAHVDLLLEVSRLVPDGIMSMDEYVTNAIIDSGLIDYWTLRLRQLW